MKKPLTLSLIIPAYNEERHIKQCLDSIALQTVLPDEVLVVDNNSTDATVSIAIKYPFVSVISETEQGMVHARNTGFKKARGNYLGRIDADTVLPNNWVQTVISFYEEETHAHTVLTGSGYFKNVKHPRIQVHFIDMFFKTHSFVAGQTLAWGPNMIIPRTVWQQLKSHVCSENNQIHEDVDISMHLKHERTKTVRQNSLRVGTRQKHLNRPQDMLRYILKLPNTVRLHHDPRWLPLYAMAIGLFIFQYPFLYVMRISE